ncbi:MAG: hypothetical protein WC912_08485 [Thermovirgaceae bacterium]
MNLYYQNPGQSSEFVIDGADYDLFRTLENDLGDGLSFLSDVDHIRMGARIQAFSDSGDVLFLGVVYSIEYGAEGGKRRYDCIAAEALLQCRQAPNIIYPGGVGLALSDVFSSDAPPQGAGVTQYCMGLLWLARSKVCDGQDTGIVSWDSDGVGTLEGWGPLVTGHDIYYGGHKLAESTLSSITGGTYRYAISGGNLYVRGAGTGAIYDVIAADGWTENHVRLGTVATDSEVEAPYNVTDTDIWGLIRDLVDETGQYVVFRREKDYVYLDISATPEARGAESAPYASLHITDDFGLQKISSPRYIPYACVVGMGADAGEVVGQRHGAGETLAVGQAWMESVYALPEARNSPDGNLDGATQDFFDAIHQDSPVEIALYQDGYRPGDWLELDIGGGNKVVGQIRTIGSSSVGPDVAVVGAPDLSLLTAFLERSETAAIEAYREWSEAIADGEAIRYGWFGATETFSDHFETIDWEGETVPILLSVEVDDPEDIDEFNIGVHFIITINDEVIKIPWQPWGWNPITNFDIGAYCNLDGTEETIDIEIEDPAGWVPDDYIFKVTISGLGADSAADSITLDINNSTLNDSDTGTYFETTTYAGTSYAYSVEDADFFPSKSPTVRVWNYNQGNSQSEWYSDVGWVYWYGQSRTRLDVGGSSYYGSWAVRNGWSYTDYTENPATSQAWTWAEINSISAGGSIRAYCTRPDGGNPYGCYARLNGAYIEVLP